MLPEQYPGNDAIGVTRWPASVSCGSAANKTLTPVSVQIGMEVERVSARAAMPCTETGVSPRPQSYVDRGIEAPAPRVKTRDSAAQPSTYAPTTTTINSGTRSQQQ